LKKNGAETSLEFKRYTTSKIRHHAGIFMLKLVAVNQVNWEASSLKTIVIITADFGCNFKYNLIQ